MIPRPRMVCTVQRSSTYDRPLSKSQNRNRPPVLTLPTLLRARTITFFVTWQLIRLYDRWHVTAFYDAFSGGRRLPPVSSENPPRGETVASLSDHRVRLTTAKKGRPIGHDHAGRPLCNRNCGLDDGHKPRTTCDRGKTDLLGPPNHED